MTGAGKSVICPVFDKCPAFGYGQIEGVLDRVRPTKGTLKEMMDQLERWLLIEALREHGNNKTAAAKVLGITREGLHKKLRAFGL